MKRRTHPSEQEHDAVTELATAMLGLGTVERLSAFLDDLCTPAELEAMTDRWRVVPLVAQGMPYREIHERTGVSITTIGRVARTLDRGAGGYAAALQPRAPRQSARHR